MEKVCCRSVMEVACMHRRWFSTSRWQWQQVVSYSALPSKYSRSSMSCINSSIPGQNPRRYSENHFYGRQVCNRRCSEEKVSKSELRYIADKNELYLFVYRSVPKFWQLSVASQQETSTNSTGCAVRTEADSLSLPLSDSLPYSMTIASSTLQIPASSINQQLRLLSPRKTQKASLQVASMFRRTWKRRNNSAATAMPTPFSPLHGQSSRLLRKSSSSSSCSSRRTLFLSHASCDPAWRDSMCISMDSEEREGRGNVDDFLFDMFKDEQTEKVHMGRFIAALTETGLRRTDPRLKEFRDNLAAVHNLQADHDASSITALDLNRDLFKRVLRDNVVLISRALRHHFVIPQWGDFCSHIEEFYWAGKALKGGHVASYIPQLARFNPDYWGVSVCSIDGQRYSVGDTSVSFTTQSCSKPITYAIALNELGADTVHRYVGTEPSGRMFNAIVLDYNNKPHNPLVNAGAIVVSAVLHQLVRPELASSEKFDFVQQYFSRLAGGETVGFSNGTFLSERENADRNYALAYYMRENKCFPEKTDLTAALDLYFQSCSMEVTTESMAVMAATLANGGICPITGDQVLQPAAVRDVLSLMHSCGMYDYSGQFAFKVGLPAKSGVCGAVMLVIPNVVGICTWSPPLDTLGNSVRGIKFAENLVEMFNFHRYDNLRFAANKKDPRREKYETRGQKVVSLLFSASTGDVTAMRRYALSGLNMSECDYDGRTALHLAASEGHLDVAKFLLEKCRVNVTPLDRWNRTPADDACQFGFTEVEKYLRDYAAEHPDQCGTDDMVKSPPPTIPEIPEEKIPSPDSTK